MRRIVCPACGEALMLSPEELALHSQFECDGCWSLLEVVREEPLKVVVVEGDFTSDDDDDDDGDGDNE